MLNPGKRNKSSIKTDCQTVGGGGGASLVSVNEEDVILLPRLVVAKKGQSDPASHGEQAEKQRQRIVLGCVCV